MDTWMIYVAGALGVAGLVAYRPLKRWVAKCRRRKGGVYVWRVDHHLNRARRVTGYVGETVSFHFRKQQHLGMSRFDPATGQVVKAQRGQRGVAMVKVPAQPWSDLNPVMHKVIKLPWWLCWKWVLRSLETLVILCTWPVYNDAKNRWNPRRIPKNLAKTQRAARDGQAVSYRHRARVGLAHAGRIAVQVAGAALIVVGAYGWMVTR
jgi:hypothetical protein